jgi:hypothetical protein
MGTAPHCAAKSSKAIRIKPVNALVKTTLAFNPAEIKTIV